MFEQELKHPLHYMCLEINCGNQQWVNKYHQPSRALKFNRLISQKPKLAIFCGQEAKGEKACGKHYLQLGTAGHGLRAERVSFARLGFKFPVIKSRLHQKAKWGQKTNEQFC